MPCSLSMTKSYSAEELLCVVVLRERGQYHSSDEIFWWSAEFRCIEIIRSRITIQWFHMVPLPHFVQISSRCFVPFAFTIHSLFKSGIVSVESDVSKETRHRNHSKYLQASIKYLAKHVSQIPDHPDLNNPFQ